MASTYPSIPPRDDLLALFRAALSNAKDLLGDARLLADAGSFPRAYALATLSWEELSKAQLCLLAVLLPEITSENFWEGFRDHKGKLSRAHGFAAFMEPVPVGSVAEYAKKVLRGAKSADKQKLRALYVDYRRGKIQLPSQITAKVARKQIKAVLEAIAFADSSFSIDSLDNLLSESIALSGGLKSAIIADPDATAAALQQAFRGGSQNALHELVFHTVTAADAGH
jgi:AbiV family abortive infection protein